jgi:hypothetical protein
MSKLFLTRFYMLPQPQKKKELLAEASATVTMNTPQLYSISISTTTGHCPTTGNTNLKPEPRVPSQKMKLPGRGVIRVANQVKDFFASQLNDTMARLNTTARDNQFRDKQPPQDVNPPQQPPAKRRRTSTDAVTSQEYEDNEDDEDDEDFNAEEAGDSSSSSSDSDSSDSDSDSSSSNSSPDSDSDSDSDSESHSAKNTTKPEDVPPASVVLYTEANPPDGQLHWYWTQRHKIFSKYSEGVWMTPDSWFEATPEAIASYVPSSAPPHTPLTLFTSTLLTTYQDKFHLVYTIILTQPTEKSPPTVSPPPSPQATPA